MRDRSWLGWLAGKLRVMAGVLVILALYEAMPWARPPRLSPDYLQLSRTGALTTATVERNEGRYLRSRAVYSYTTPDGKRHTGRDPDFPGNSGDAMMVYYLPGEPDRSIPRNQFLELEQLAVAVAVVLACAATLAERVHRSLNPPQQERHTGFTRGRHIR